MSGIEIALFVIVILLLTGIIGVAIFFGIKNHKNKKQKNDYNSTNETTTLIKTSIELLGKNLSDRQESAFKQMDSKIDNIKLQNKTQTDEIRELVSTKLNKNIDEKFSQTFKTITESLTKVGQSVGELKKFDTTATNLVAALKNVKVSGVYGETQLDTILRTFLAPNQYVQNFQSDENSQERVEFAIKFPTQNNDFVYLPIDSKFSLNLFLDLIEAQKTNNISLVEEKTKQIRQTVIGMAKDISNKYIKPPKTTNYGIMFIPVESLYLEIVKMNLLDELQNKYQVVVAGPTTISALLISLQMGFKSLKIQEKATEIWNILAALKSQFKLLDKDMNIVSKAFANANNTFESLAKTRFRMISSKLKEVDQLPDDESNKLLGMDNPEKIEGNIVEGKDN